MAGALSASRDRAQNAFNEGHAAGKSAAITGTREMNKTTPDCLGHSPSMLTSSTIEITKAGPHRITGSLELTDTGGQPAPRDTGASLERYALCRCGQSQNKPCCSGVDMPNTAHCAPACLCRELHTHSCIGSLTLN